MNLSNETLSSLPSHIKTPGYNRQSLNAGIVHIGLGNFHRAHQSWYQQKLLQQGLDQEWAIIGASVREADTQQRENLLAQDCLTSLIELSPDNTSVEIVGSMIDYVEIREDNIPLILQLADPAIRIVSLTVTESGYFIDPATGGFDANQADIQYDANNPSSPRTAFGAIIEALRIRKDSGAGPFTLQSCDNLQGNGDVLKHTILSLAAFSDKNHADWIAHNCSFPNSMVDCIVPATGEKEKALIRRMGIDDAVPVTHENFRQWVIEDKFCAGRPAWEHVGATFTDKVHDYEAQKIRVLNAGHQIVANAGELLSIGTISGCMEEPLIKNLFEKIEQEEIVPHIKPVPDITPENYVKLISERFANPAIFDTTRRVSYDGSSRHPGFLHPIIRDGLSHSISVEGLALAEALWARMCAGIREDGSTIENNDPHWDALVKVAQQTKQSPEAWLAQKSYYGDLADEQAFSVAFNRWISQLWETGVQATITSYLQY